MRTKVSLLAIGLGLSLSTSGLLAADLVVDETELGSYNPFLDHATSVNASHTVKHPFHQSVNQSEQIFIESSPVSYALNQGVNNLTGDKSGQWLVSFDLNQLDFQLPSFDLGQNLAFDKTSNQSPNYDWKLGTSYVSSDKTSQFYFNYGNKKVPISISFDDPIQAQNSFEQEEYQLGFSQEINQSWKVSISYLKSDRALKSLDAELDAAMVASKEYQYLFDFSRNNQLETLNFSPLLNSGGRDFLQDVSAIQINVSRQLSDHLNVSASLERQELDGKHLGFNPSLSGRLDNSLLASPLEQVKADSLTLEGDYQLAKHWSLAANVEHQQQNFQVFNSASSQQTLDAGRYDATTLDIGLQYQSSWDQVGVVIRIDLMNLLGVDNLEQNSTSGLNNFGLDDSGLVPFSFQSPKHIKLSGSINF